MSSCDLATERERRGKVSFFYITLQSSYIWLGKKTKWWHTWIAINCYTELQMEKMMGSMLSYSLWGIVKMEKIDFCGLVGGAWLWLNRSWYYFLGQFAHPYCEPQCPKRKSASQVSRIKLNVSYWCVISRGRLPVITLIYKFSKQREGEHRRGLKSLICQFAELKNESTVTGAQRQKTTALHAKQK